MAVLRAGDERGDSGGHGSEKCSLVPGLLKVEFAGLADGVGMSPRDESKMTVRSSLHGWLEWSWHLVKGEWLRGETWKELVEGKTIFSALSTLSAYPSEERT